MRKLFFVAWIAWLALPALALSVLAMPGPLGTVRGAVRDTSGRAVAGARISLLNLRSGVRVNVSSGAAGRFRARVGDGVYQLVIRKTGFTTYRRQLAVTGASLPRIHATLGLSAVTQIVTVHARTVMGATVEPSQDMVFHSSLSKRVLNRLQMDAAGPEAGAAQTLAYAPGAAVTGYGNTGTTKYTVLLNGVMQGWGGYGGYTQDGSLGVTFDGIPVSDPSTNLWQSSTMPQTEMLQNITVTYGPGDPVGRWYNNVGGGIEYTPVQPTVHPTLGLWANYGSYNQKILFGRYTTGLWHGWSSVLAGGWGGGDSFRKGPDGFTNTSYDRSVYGKTSKSWTQGVLEIGGYFDYTSGYRPQVIPVAANPDITMNGQPGAPIYSQATSGFYSTLPFASYNKNDSNELATIYSRQLMNLDSSTTLHNQTWYMLIRRTHRRINDAYNPGGQLQEWNNPHTASVGDEIWLSHYFNGNTLDFGVYYIHNLFNTRNNFFNPADGGGPGIVNAGGKFRSSYFAQDDYALFAQDKIHPWTWLSITPGLRFTGFRVDYTTDPFNDFSFVPGVTINVPQLNSCPLDAAFTGNPSSTAAKYQGSLCGAHASRHGYEPSFNVGLRPLPWLSVYGGYMETLRAPELGGGGGLFQAVEPSTYQLSKGEYSQAGVKMHFYQAGPLQEVLFGANYFHLNYLDQEIDIGLANGDTIFASGSSKYNGINAFFDNSPAARTHVFVNFSATRATYTNYQAAGYKGTPPVPYVPQELLNIGGYYNWSYGNDHAIQPRLWYQWTGAQHIFDNTVAAPSSQTMPSFGTLNLAFNLPFSRHYNFRLNFLNLLNAKYNQYEYISSGGYFGTPTGGYLLAYPGAPFTAYGTFSLHF